MGSTTTGKNLDLEILFLDFCVFAGAHGRIVGRLKGGLKGIVTARGPDRLKEPAQNRRKRIQRFMYPVSRRADRSSVGGRMVSVDI